MAAGVDTVTPLTTQAQATAVKNAGKTFIMRYYKDNGYPQLTQSEAQLISAAGLKVGVVFETDPSGIGYFTASKGKSDALAAMNQARSIGQPADSVIYFAIDFNASPTQATGAIKTYFQAVFDEFNYLISSLGYPYILIGVYGDGAVCSEIKDSSGLAQYSWLGGAASYHGNSTYTNWNLKQSATTTTIDGINYDLDQSSGAFGGFTV